MAMIPPELERTYQVVIVPGEMGKKEMRADVSQITAIEIGTDLKGNLCLRRSYGAMR